jgi:hypothetical protein
MSQEKGHIDTPQKKATAVLSAKKTRIFSDANATDQRLLRPTGEFLVICSSKISTVTNLPQPSLVTCLLHTRLHNSRLLLSSDR